MTNTSQLSFIQQGKNKIKLWELTIRVAVSVFYLEREGPQDYASGVAIRSSACKVTSHHAVSEELFKVGEVAQSADVVLGSLHFFATI